MADTPKQAPKKYGGIGGILSHEDNPEARAYREKQDALKNGRNDAKPVSVTTLEASVEVPSGETPASEPQQTQAPFELPSMSLEDLEKLLGHPVEPNSFQNYIGGSKTELNRLVEGLEVFSKTHPSSIFREGGIQVGDTFIDERGQKRIYINGVDGKDRKGNPIGSRRLTPKPDGDEQASKVEKPIKITLKGLAASIGQDVSNIYTRLDALKEAIENNKTEVPADYLKPSDLEASNKQQQEQYGKLLEGINGSLEGMKGLVKAYSGLAARRDASQQPAQPQQPAQQSSDAQCHVFFVPQQQPAAEGQPNRLTMHVPTISGRPTYYPINLNKGRRPHPERYAADMDLVLRLSYEKAEKELCTRKEKGFFGGIKRDRISPEKQLLIQRRADDILQSKYLPQLSLKYGVGFARSEPREAYQQPLQETAPAHQPVHIQWDAAPARTS